MLAEAQPAGTVLADTWLAGTVLADTWLAGTVLAGTWLADTCRAGTLPAGRLFAAAWAAEMRPAEASAAGPCLLGPGPGPGLAAAPAAAPPPEQPEPRGRRATASTARTCVIRNSLTSSSCTWSSVTGPARPSSGTVGPSRGGPAADGRPLSCLVPPLDSAPAVNGPLRPRAELAARGLGTAI